MDKAKVIATVPRLGLGIVFLVAALSKLFMGAAVDLPIDKVLFFLSQETGLLILALVELAVGLMLCVGFFKRIAAGAAGLLLLGFIAVGSSLGFFESAFLIKDVAMVTTAVYLVMAKKDCYSVDSWLKNRK